MNQESGHLPAVERAVPGEIGWARMQADHLARYLHARNFVAGKRVLDAGTGPGYGAALLADAGAVEVVAIDIDAETIASAQRAYGSANIRFVIDNCETLANAGSAFDVICSFENIEHLQRPEAFLQAAATAMAEGGILLCSTPDREGPYEPWKDGHPNNPFHTIEWYADEFKDLLSKYFRRVDLRTQVMAHAAVQRASSFQGLVDHLNYLWSNPALRLERVVRRALRRPVSWPNVSGLDIPTPEDYPVVNRNLVRAFGIPFCHYAQCSIPIRGGP